MSFILPNSEIYTIDHFLTSDECTSLIKSAESIGFEEAGVSIDGKQKVLKMIRDNERVLFKDELYAAQLWKKLLPFVKPIIGNSKAIGLNEQFRFYKYSEGQRFKMHKDGSYIRNETEFSCYTFMVYLNEDFQGGKTIFKSGEYVTPQTGRALLFEHNLSHEGEKLSNGTKYVLRTDVMYQLQIHEV